MKRNIIMGALVLAALCAFSTPAMAQRGRGGNRGGYRGGYSGYRGGYGGYRGGYSGYHHDHDGYRGYGYGGYGYRGYGGYGGYGYGAGLTSGLLLGNALGGYNYGYVPNYGYGNYNYGYVPSYNYSGYDSGYVPNYGLSNYVPPVTATYADPSITASSPTPSTRDSLYYAPETANNTAHLRILVPASAKVWVGGVETTKVGSDRGFESPPLTPGREYTYEVKARWMNSGEPVEQTRKVKVEANRTTTVDFDKLAEVAK